ncbi:voltage-gated potassium channel [Allopseudospirillum japonicum]|uniref:Voltage-gated potassium channel n=1 Tax=Allopseudospirillum japonicum TaxID=64971 RepID=A0A1H6U4G2_9GAMM|nr:potassium channel family protein [Allopseudospirillum japonicum]SEI87183.1 voltage-gated potassium channel [Allopseudospirillum japonicum]
MNYTKIFKNLGFAVAGLAIYLGLLSTLIHFEKQAESPSINTLSDAVWYSIVTMTTVGYGDMSPQTELGKIIGYIFIFASMGVLGFLIGRISSFINEIHENRRLGYNGTKFMNHVVIIGWDRFAQNVVDQLVASDIKVAVIMDQRAQLELISENYDREQVYFLLADHHNFELARKAHIEAASIVFVNLEDDTEKLVYLMNSQQFYYRDLKYGVVVNDDELIPAFEAAGADIVLSRDEFDAKLTASFIFEQEVGKYTEKMISGSKKEDDFEIQQYRVISQNRFRDKLYSEAFFDIKKQLDAVLIGLATTIEGERVVLSNPDDPNLRISEGDYLILIASGQVSKKLQRSFGVNEGSL